MFLNPGLASGEGWDLGERGEAGRSRGSVPMVLPEAKSELEVSGVCSEVGRAGRAFVLFIFHKDPNRGPLAPLRQPCSLL